jgi:hypothetical protein
LPRDTLIKLEVGLALPEDVPVRHRLGGVVPGGWSARGTIGGGRTPWRVGGERLFREDRRVTPDLAEKLSFFDQQVQGFLVAGFLEPNLRQLRDSIAAALVWSQGSSGER